MSFNINIIDEAQNNTNQIMDRSISSIKLCLHDTENVVNVLIRMLKSKNGDSNDIKYLEDTYLVRLKSLQQYFNNVNYDSFTNDIKTKIQELTEFYKLIGTKITQIINKNNVPEVAKIMSNMPILVTDMFSNIKDYTIASLQEVETGKKELANSDKFQSLLNNSNSNLNESNDGILSSIGGSASTILGNLWKVITFQSTNGLNPISKSINDITDNINNLNAQMNKSITKNSTISDIGAFFTSDAFVRTATSLVLLTGLTMIIVKAYRSIKRKLGTYWRKMWS